MTRMINDGCIKYFYNWLKKTLKNNVFALTKIQIKQAKWAEHI